jgi:PRC-barrel domain
MLVDASGARVGKFEAIYLEEETDRPLWAAVRISPFRKRFVPLSEVEVVGDKVRVPFRKRQVRDAPRIDPDGWVTREEEEQLFRHYGLEGSNSSSPSDEAGEPGSENSHGPAQRVSGAQERDLKRARLKRYVVTETVKTRSEFEP